MSGVQEAFAWLALPLGLLVVAAALGVALMRSLFAALVFALVASMAAGAGALALGAPSVAIGVAVIGGAFAFLVLTGAILLTTRAARARRLIPRAPGAVLAGLIAGALFWAAPDLARHTPQTAAPTQSESVLLGVLSLAGALCAYGLLGFGERAVFSRREDRGR